MGEGVITGLVSMSFIRGFQLDYVDCTLVDVEAARNQLGKLR